MANRDDQKDRRPQGLSWGGSAAATKSEPPVESGRDVKGVFGQGKVAQSSPPGEIKPPVEAPRPAPLPPMKSMSSAPPKGSFLPKSDAVDDLFSGDKAAPQPAVRTEESTLAVLGSWASVKPKDAKPGRDAAAPTAPDPRSGVAGAFSLSSLRGDGKKRNPLAATMMGVSPPPAMSAAPPPAAPPAAGKAPAAPPPAGGKAPAPLGLEVDDAGVTPVTDVLERPTVKPPTDLQANVPELDDLDAALPPVDEEQTDPGGVPSAALLAAAEEPAYPEEEVTVTAAPTYPNVDGSLSNVLPEGSDDLFSGGEPLLAPPPPVELSSEPPELLEWDSDAPPVEPPAPPGLADTMVQPGAPPAAPEAPSKLHNTLVGNGPKPQELEELFAAAGLKPAESGQAAAAGKPAKAKKAPPPVTRGELPVTSAEPPRRRLSFTQRALLLGSLAGLLGGGLIALLRHQQAAAPAVEMQLPQGGPVPVPAEPPADKVSAAKVPTAGVPAPSAPSSLTSQEAAPTKPLEQAPVVAPEAKPAQPVEQEVVPAVPATPQAQEPLLPEGMSHGAMLRRAEQEAGNGDPKRAEAMLRALLERKPRDHHVMEPLVRLLLRQGRGSEAVPLAERMVAKRSRRASYRELLGDARRLAGDSEGAKTAYQKALELDPSNARVRSRVE